MRTKQAKRGRPGFLSKNGEKPKVVNLWVQKADYSEIERRAKTLGRSKSSVIREAINAYLTDRRRTVPNVKTARA
jgi:hypothetical protein